MVKNQAFQSYKQTEQIYVNGIETPHGRIKLLYETIIDNSNCNLGKNILRAETAPVVALAINNMNL